MTTPTSTPGAEPTSTTPDKADEPREVSSRGVLQYAEKYALLGLLALVVIFFSIQGESGPIFTTLANWQALLGGMAVVTIVAMALLVPLIAGNLDFTVGATAGVSSVVTASLMSNHQQPLFIAALAALAVGLVIGVVNGVVVAYLGVSSFISTLGLSILLGGLIQWYTGGIDIVTGIDPHLTDFGSGLVAQLPRPFALVVAVTAVCWFLMTNTVYGRQLRAVGSNPRATSLMGINVRRTVFVSFALSGTLAGLAGIMLVARNGGAVSGAGADQLFPAFAAVFLGATTIDPGRYNAIGTFVGVLFVAVAVSGLTLAGAQSWVPDVFNGGTLVIAVIVSTLLSRQRSREL